VPLSIEVRVEGAASADLIKAVRAATGAPLKQVKDRLNRGDAVYSTVLVPEEFYSGIKELLAFLATLEALGAQYHIESNGRSIDKAELEKIKLDLDHLSLEDFR
jgi:hypothetical protein